MRILAFVFGLGLVLFAPTAHSEESVLHQSVKVGGNYVRLGDLFSAAGDKAEEIVAYAPAPGKRAVLDARWLYRVAKKYGLSWRPISRNQRVVVRRESRLVGRREIEETILAALVEQGADPDLQVVLNKRSLRLYVPADAEETMAVEDVFYDQESRRFSVVVIAPADDPAAKQVRVRGRLYKIKDVPVLVSRKLAKRVIKKNDIKWVRMRVDRLQRDIVLDAADLIGKVPRRSLRGGEPIRASDVHRPLLVSRGDLVTMVLRGPAMLLTVRGRAQEDGSKGDTVRVSNTQSNNLVEAVVVGPNMVAVTGSSRLAVN